MKCVQYLMSVWLFGAALAAHAEPVMAPFTAQDRVLVVAPHPDDETLGTGGAIQQAVAAGAQVRVLYLTNGDHNQVAFKLYNHTLYLSAKQYRGFGEKRLDEARAATKHLGLGPEQLVFLGYPDWGTLSMWRDCWDDAKPFKSTSTRAVEVPYKNNYGYRHPYRPEAVLKDVVNVIGEYRPTRLFLPHPCDTNPDHRAAANFVRLAMLELEPAGVRPELLYYLIHFGEWPRPYRYHPELALAPPLQLLDDGEWLTLSLTPAQVEKKYHAILENRTQITTRQYFLESLARRNELFAHVRTEHIFRVPSSESLDWRQAVRNKTLRFIPADHTGKLNGQTPPVSLSMEETFFLRQGEELIAQIDFKNRFGPRTNVHLFLFGYRRGVVFAKLPKIQVNVNPLGAIHVYDDEEELAEHDVQVTTIGDSMIVRVPLRLLGGADIDHVFTATRTNLTGISPDDTAWQLYEMMP